MVVRYEMNMNFVHNANNSTFLHKSLDAGDSTSLNEGVNVALSLVCLCHEQVGDVATNVIFIADSVSTKDLLQPGTVVSKKPSQAVNDGTHTLALTKARSQF